MMQFEWEQQRPGIFESSWAMTSQMSCIHHHTRVAMPEHHNLVGQMGELSSLFYSKKIEK